VQRGVHIIGGSGGKTPVDVVHYSVQPSLPGGGAQCYGLEARYYQRRCRTKESRGLLPASDSVPDREHSDLRLAKISHMNQFAWDSTCRTRKDLSRIHETQLTVGCHSSRGYTETQFSTAPASDPLLAEAPDLQLPLP
jgi:hypothetical protein